MSTDENEEIFEYGKRVKDADGNEVIQYATRHVSLFFIVAAEPGKSGKTLAIWDADTEGEVRRKLDLRKLTEPLQAKEGYSGIQYHLYKHLQGKKGTASQLGMSEAEGTRENRTVVRWQLTRCCDGFVGTQES